MGVSGSGKSLIGQLLAKQLGHPFLDADDYHPQANIDKMSSGIPLNDQDRLPWLEHLNGVAQTHLETGCVIACSALKQKYRDLLSMLIQDHSEWIYLKGSYDLIFKRMSQRKNHFMDPNMLRSQFEALEPPLNAIEVSIDQSPEVMLLQIQNKLK